MDFDRYMSDGHFSHAVVIGGDGRAEAAVKLAAEMVGGRGRRKALEGIHPDVIRLDEDGAMIKVEAARELRKSVFVRPNEADCKIYIINDADNMNPNAANALLKVLEEPPAYAAFILTASNPAALPVTILSRCVRLSARGESREAVPEIREAAANYAFALAKNDESALFEFCLGLEKSKRDFWPDFCGEAKALLLDGVRASSGLDKAPSAAALELSRALTPEKTAKLCEIFSEIQKRSEFNASPALQAGYLCVSSWEVVK